MIRKLQKARGFTLIELMIVVAIIGILAAIAIPNFLKYQLRAKRGEGSVNTAGIRTSQISYMANNDNYQLCTASPAATPAQNKVGFTDEGGFTTIAWKPEGQVYFQYAVNTNTAGTDFTASAYGDVDGDVTDYSCWMYIKPDPVGGTSVQDSAHTDCDASRAGNEKVALSTLEDVY